VVDFRFFINDNTRIKLTLNDKNKCGTGERSEQNNSMAWMREMEYCLPIITMRSKILITKI